GELAHPREGPRGFPVAPAVDGDERPPEFMEKRHLAPQTLRGLGLGLQQIERRVEVQADLLVGEARSRMGCRLPVVADRALDVPAALEVRRELARDVHRASAVRGLQALPDRLAEAP